MSDLLPWWAYLLMMVFAIFLQYMVRCIIHETCKKKRNAAGDGTRSLNVESTPRTNDDAVLITALPPITVPPPSYQEVTSTANGDSSQDFIPLEPLPPSYEVALGLSLHHDTSVENVQADINANLSN